MKLRLAFTLMIVALLATGTAAAAQAPSDAQRLNQALDQLAANPQLGGYAQAERQLARQAVQALAQASSKRHAYALYIAEHRVDIAEAAAKLDQARGQLADLQNQRTQILLKASQRDAAATQQALEQAQLRNQVAAEQTQRLEAQGQASAQAAQKAQAEAEQAQAKAAQARKLAQSQSRAAALAKKQAALAASAVQLMRQQLASMKPHQGAEGLQMTVGGEAFASGSATLRPEAKSHLGKLVDFVKSAPGKHVRIEGYTDSTGNAAVNQSLSLQRAQAVAQVLTAHGVPGSRITSVGMGESNPVASNDTAAGRAKNRRVVVILQSH